MVDDWQYLALASLEVEWAAAAFAKVAWACPIVIGPRAALAYFDAPEECQVCLLTAGETGLVPGIFDVEIVGGDAVPEGHVSASVQECCR